VALKGGEFYTKKFEWEVKIRSDYWTKTFDAEAERGT